MKNHGPIVPVSIALVAALLCIAAVVPAGTARAADSPVAAAPDAKLQEVPFPAVHLEDDFWAPRIAIDQAVTIPDMLDLAGTQGKIDNFAIVAGKKPGKIRLYNSPDSDLYKLLEAAAYTLAWRQDPNLDRRIDEIIATIAAAQAPDGYINTQYMLPLEAHATPTSMRRKRDLDYGIKWKWRGDIQEWPAGMGQLYCAGHLFEAAAAHYRATGKRTLLDVAIHMADCMAARFPLDKPIDYADHPQAGIGLVKLHEVTGEKRFLKLAEHIVDCGKPARPVDIGNGESLKPLAQQRQAYGHAVRSEYLYSAGTDICRHLGRPDLREALVSIWSSLVGRRMYLTGGTGNGTPREQHGEDYDLPNGYCYCECCANIALAQWAHRMNLLTGQALYADIVELVAYNGGLSGISLDGRRFAYSNVLEAGMIDRDDEFSGVRRRYLFCCPSKLPGFLAGISRWMYATDADGVIVNLYAASSATVRAAGGDVRLRQRTAYPWDGLVKITVEPGEPRDFSLRLRVPTWLSARPAPTDLYHYGPAAAGQAQPVCVKVNGAAVADAKPEDGYLRIARRWQNGDTVELALPMQPRRVYADQHVGDDRGRVAMMRGPIVYCLEGIDNPQGVLNMALPKDAAITAEHKPGLLGGVTVLRTRALADGKTPVDITAVPYYAWENRGIDEMAVWLIEDAALCYKRPAPDPANRATLAIPKASCDQAAPGRLDALNDGALPKSSADTSAGRVTWLPRKGSTEWVQYEFVKAQPVDRIAVYWFQQPDGPCRLPQSWRLLYLDDKGKWKPVANPSPYSLALNGLNYVTFDPVITKALRIEAKLQKGFSGGICDWRIERFRNTDG